MHDLYEIQGPNVTRDAREKIAFHAFVVEDSAKLYNSGACVCKSNVEIRIAGYNLDFGTIYAPIHDGPSNPGTFVLPLVF